MKLMKPAKIAQSIPDEIQEILGSPPLLSTEELKVYNATLAYFANDIPPSDVITWFLLKDLADHRTDIARYRRLQRCLIQKVHESRISKNIAESCAAFERAQQARRKLKEELAVRTVQDKKDLEQHMDDVAVEIATELEMFMGKVMQTYDQLQHIPAGEVVIVDGFAEWLPDHQKIDQLLSTAEARFAATMREIERHVSGFGKSLQEKFDAVIDGEVLEAQEEEAAA